MIVTGFLVFMSVMSAVQKMETIFQFIDEAETAINGSKYKIYSEEFSNLDNLSIGAIATVPIDKYYKLFMNNFVHKNM